MRKKDRKLKSVPFPSRLIRNVEDESETICQALEKLLRKEAKLESINIDKLAKVYRELKKLLKKKPTVDELVNAVGTESKRKLLKRLGFSKRK